MTVLIYVNTSKEVGDVDHSRWSQTRTPQKNGSENTTRMAWRLIMTSWSKPLCVVRATLVWFLLWNRPFDSTL